MALLILTISTLLVISPLKTQFLSALPRHAQMPNSTTPTSNLTTTLPTSSNESSTFSNTTLFNLSNNTGFSFFPRIATSLVNNSVYVVWADNTTGNGDILFRKSGDGGNTFEKTINLSNNTGFSFFPRIATSLVNNSVYVVWADNTTGNGDILFRKSGDGGATFDQTINLSNDTNESSNPQIAIFDVQSKNVYVVWQDKTPNASLNRSSSILLKTSVDGGSTFGPAINLNHGLGTPVNPQIVTFGNIVYVVWQDKTPQGSEEVIFWKGVSLQQQQPQGLGPTSLSLQRP